MAKGKKAGGRDWKPGQSGNPSGRAKTPADVLEARKFNRIELERALGKLILSPEAELHGRLGNPSTPYIERMIISLMIRAVEEGDPARINCLLDRIFGKVPQGVEMEVTLPKPTVIKWKEDVILLGTEGDDSVSSLSKAEV